MVLADPGRMHAEPVGVQRLLGDLGDELVRRPRVVLVVIVAEGEVAEVHVAPPLSPSCRRFSFLLPGIISAFATVVNATVKISTRRGRPRFDIVGAGPYERPPEFFCRTSQFVAKAPSFDFSEYLPYLINRVGSALVIDFEQAALVRPHLSIAMWRVLAVLSADGGQRQIDVASKTSIDVSTLSRVVTRLVKMGLVTRTRSTSNSREVVVRLTAKGTTLLTELIPKAIAAERTAIAGVSAKDLAVVRRSLRRMYQNLAGSPRADVVSSRGAPKPASGAKAERTR